MRIRGIKINLYLSLVLFVILIIFFILSLYEFEVFRIIGIISFLFLISGITLMILNIKFLAKRELKIFLNLAGICAISPFLFTILHNIFYALAEISKNVIQIKILMEIFHTISFLIAIIISPIVFLISVIISIILINKNN